MAEGMTMEDVSRAEFQNSGSSPTNNEQFDKDGYLLIKDLWDPSELYRPVPSDRGLVNYWGKDKNQYTKQDLETQVEGSYATYWHPQYRSIHSGIRLKLESIIGNKLYNTYYYDRYYFPGQELTIHADRPSCEISVSIHISSNVSNPWPLCIKTPDTETYIGENRSVLLEPGDGMLYKGCERPHWRDPLPREYKRKWYGKKVEKEGLYYHQVFFHYVLADGIRSHCAFDRSKE